MSTIVKMPQLGESVAEGTIGRWLKKPGDRIERDEPLVEIQTDKVNAEVPSPVAGILQEILLPEGSTVAVKTDIAVIGDEASSPAASPASAPVSAPVSPPEPAPAPASGPAPAPPPAPSTFSYDNTPGGGPTSSARVGSDDAQEETRAQEENQENKQFLTPVVMRMVQEHGLDIATIQGSGRGGRVTRKDVERALSGAPAAPQAVSSPPRAVESTSPSPGVGRPLSPMRRAIADHMSRARSDIPDAWSMTEIDVTPLVRQRAAALPTFQQREGFELTFLPFFVKAVLVGLRAVPELNATWTGDGITLHQQYNLGIAVSVPNGLVVPVLRGADQLSVAGIAHALRGIVQKARSGKLGPDDLQGATFTVNNPGSLGSIMSQPIVPLGQAGIVTMEAIVKRPVVTADDAIAVRSMMNSCLSFDHRILDGAQALLFLRTLKEQLETVEYPIY